MSFIGLLTAISYFANMGVPKIQIEVRTLIQKIIIISNALMMLIFISMEVYLIWAFDFTTAIYSTLGGFFLGMAVLICLCITDKEWLDKLYTFISVFSLPICGLALLVYFSQ
jgi:hypothetical protein